jgi:hypothetical protein
MGVSTQPRAWVEGPVKIPQLDYQGARGDFEDGKSVVLRLNEGSDHTSDHEQRTRLGEVSSARGASRSSGRSGICWLGFRVHRCDDDCVIALGKLQEDTQMSL